MHIPTQLIDSSNHFKNRTEVTCNFKRYAGKTKLNTLTVEAGQKIVQL